MKKGLIFLLGIISFLGINTVNAEEIYLEYDTDINRYKNYINEIGYETFNNVINDSINYYNLNLSIDYPYFFISLTYNAINNNPRIQLLAFSELNYNYYYTFDSFSDGSFYKLPVSGKVITLLYEYNPDNNSFSEPDISGNYSNPHLIHISPEQKEYRPYSYYYSNFDLYYKGSSFTEENDTLHYLNPNDTLYIPSYEDSTKYSSHKANEDFLIEPYYIYDDNDSLSGNNLTTINLNDYSYVILSLKDYTPRETFTTIMYVKGQLCPTTVYNYGLHEKKEYVSGWQSPNCGTYSNDYVRHLNYIREEDIENHAVYYLTRYDSSKPNLVKVDTSIYDITYITKEEENNPIITIDGKKYQTLPYSDLTDTSILTEKEGLKPNYTCGKYDTDCFLDSSGVNVKNLFSNPLETLKGVWDAILSIFALITNFIALLPPTMQAFLILAFGVGTALGIIKILL